MSNEQLAPIPARVLNVSAIVAKATAVRPERLMWLVDALLDVSVITGTAGETERTTLIIAASPKQLASGVTESELAQIGLTLDEAVEEPARAVNREFKVIWRDADEKNLVAGYRILTGTPKAKLQAALKAALAEAAKVQPAA